MSDLSAAELAVVADHLARAGDEDVADLRARRIAGGRSNETFAIEQGSTPRWILRRPPVMGRTPSAHDVSREHRVTSALAAAGYPVARPVVLSDEPAWGPFTLVEFVEGRTIRSRDDLAALDDAQVDTLSDELVARLAQLHGLDHRAIGLADFGRPDGYAERQLRRWSGQWDIVGDDRPEAAALLERLRRTVPTQGGAAVVHGDFRIDNTLVTIGDTPAVEAVVDWELSTIGDPVADVALMAVYRHTALDDVLEMPAAWASERWPSAQELGERYARTSGTDLDDWEFHLGLAAYKLAVISAGIDYRARASTGGAEGAGAARAVSPMLDLGLTAWGD